MFQVMSCEKDIWKKVSEAAEKRAQKYSVFGSPEMWAPWQKEKGAERLPSKCRSLHNYL